MGANRNPGLWFPLYWPSECGNNWIRTLEACAVAIGSTFTSTSWSISIFFESKPSLRKGIRMKFTLSPKNTSRIRASLITRRIGLRCSFVYWSCVYFIHVIRWRHWCGLVRSCINERNTLRGARRGCKRNTTALRDAGGTPRSSSKRFVSFISCLLILKWLIH